MKTFKLKSWGLFLLYGSLLLAVMSCGQDNNRVSGDQIGNNTNTIPNGQFPTLPGITGTQSNHISQLYSQTQCQYGRLPDVNFTLAGIQASGNTFYGTPTQGTLPGQVQNIYLGRSSSGAILIISKVVGQGSGFNVTLSLCKEVNPYNANDVIVGANTPLNNLQLGATVLDESARCPTGSIDYSMVRFYPSALGGQPLSYTFSPACQ